MPKKKQPTDEMPSFIGEEAGVAKAMPTDAALKNLAAKAQELETLEQRIENGEALLASLKEQANTLRHKTLPDLMALIGTDRIGIPGADADLVEKPYYRANIAAEWTQERKDAAFAYLEGRGDGALVRTQVTVSFGKGELRFAKMLERTIRESKRFGKFEPVVARTVPWNTLTAFVKEQVEKGRTLDLEVLGATVGRIAEIKKRKT